MDHSEKMRLEGRKPGLGYMKEVDINPKIPANGKVLKPSKVVIFLERKPMLAIMESFFWSSFLGEDLSRNGLKFKDRKK